MLAERAEKVWDPAHKKCQAEAVTKQQQSKELDKDADSMSLYEKLCKENCDAELEMAEALDKKFKDNSVSHWL